MNYPIFAAALTHCLNHSPAGGISNARALAQKIEVSPSTVTRHTAGEILPSREIFANMLEAFPEAHQNHLIRAYMTDCLPSAFRTRISPEIRTEVLQENQTDDIAAICSLLESFQPAHVSLIRYMLERAATTPGVLNAMLSTAKAMRGL